MAEWSIMSKKRIFLVWAKTARRATTLAQFFDAELIILPLSRKQLFFRLIRYAILAIRTLLLLNRIKPDLIFAQCPPLQILLPVYIYTAWQGGKYLIDAHSGAFIGKGIHFPLYLRWFKFFAQKAIMTIVPNEEIASKFTIGRGLRYFILEDGIPDLPVRRYPEPSPQEHSKSVAVICGFGADEPIEEVIKVAKLLPDTHFYITGDLPRNQAKAKKRSPVPNLTFTGFLAEPDYIKLLNQADLIMVLTNRPATILCGAYEGLGLQKPLVLSHTLTLQQYFPRGAVFVPNTAFAIAQGVKKAFDLLPELKIEVLRLAAEKKEMWLKRFQALKEEIGRPKS